LLERGVHGLDLANQIRPADRLQLSIQRRYVSGDCFAGLALCIGELLLVAKQKILFGAPALQQRLSLLVNPR